MYYLKPKNLQGRKIINFCFFFSWYASYLYFVSDDYGVNRAEEWFFFTSRDREHENEKIQNGVTVDGYWQVIGEDDEIIKQNNETLGFRKILEFYKGNPPNGDNTSWIMHEIKVNDQHTVAADDTKVCNLDIFDLCTFFW